MNTDLESPFEVYGGYLRRCTAEETELLDAEAEAEAKRQAWLADLRERAGRDADGESAGQLTEACGDPLLGASGPA